MRGIVLFPTKDSKVWVLLVENPLKKMDFQQQGPFRQSEVIEKYDTGEVQENDYVWRPGMKKWQKIKTMPELILSRKPATRFKKLEEKEVFAADLEDPETKAFESFTDMPIVIEPYSGGEVNEPSIKPLLPSVRSTKSFKTPPYLPSLIENFNHKKKVKIFLSFIALFFFAGLFNPKLFVNFKNAKRAVYGYFSPSYAASYLMIRPSMIEKKIIRFRSDAKKGAYVEVLVYDLSGNKMTLFDTKNDFVSLPLNSAGVAEVDLSKFNLKPFKNYTVVAKMGGLKAKKNVIYVP